VFQFFNLVDHFIDLVFADFDSSIETYFVLFIFALHSVDFITKSLPLQIIAVLVFVLEFFVLGT